MEIFEEGKRLAQRRFECFKTMSQRGGHEGRSAEAMIGVANEKKSAFYARLLGVRSGDARMPAPPETWSWPPNALCILEIFTPDLFGDLSFLFPLPRHWKAALQFDRNGQVWVLATQCILGIASGDFRGKTLWADIQASVPNTPIGPVPSVAPQAERFAAFFRISSVQAFCDEVVGQNVRVDANGYLLKPRVPELACALGQAPRRAADESRLTSWNALPPATTVPPPAWSQQANEPPGVGPVPRNLRTERLRRKNQRSRSRPASRRPPAQGPGRAHLTPAPAPARNPAPREMPAPSRPLGNRPDSDPRPARNRGTDPHRDGRHSPFPRDTTEDLSWRAARHRDQAFNLANHFDEAYWVVDHLRRADHLDRQRPNHVVPGPIPFLTIRQYELDVQRAELESRCSFERERADALDAKVRALEADLKQARSSAADSDEVRAAFWNHWHGAYAWDPRAGPPGATGTSQAELTKSLADEMLSRALLQKELSDTQVRLARAEDLLKHYLDQSLARTQGSPAAEQPVQAFAVLPTPEPEPTAAPEVLAPLEQTSPQAEPEVLRAPATARLDQLQALLGEKMSWELFSLLRRSMPKVTIDHWPQPFLDVVASDPSFDPQHLGIKELARVWAFILEKEVDPYSCCFSEGQVQFWTAFLAACPCIEASLGAVAFHAEAWCASEEGQAAIADLRVHSGVPAMRPAEILSATLDSGTQLDHSPLAKLLAFIGDSRRGASTTDTPLRTLAGAEAPPSPRSEQDHMSDAPEFTWLEESAIVLQDDLADWQAHAEAQGTVLGVLASARHTLHLASGEGLGSQETPEQTRRVALENKGYAEEVARAAIQLCDGLVIDAALRADGVFEASRPWMEAKTPAPNDASEIGDFVAAGPRAVQDLAEVASHLAGLTMMPQAASLAGEACAAASYEIFTPLNAGSVRSYQTWKTMGSEASSAFVKREEHTKSIPKTPQEAVSRLPPGAPSDLLVEWKGTEVSALGFRLQDADGPSSWTFKPLHPDEPVVFDEPEGDLKLAGITSEANVRRAYSSGRLPTLDSMNARMPRLAVRESRQLTEEDLRTGVPKIVCKDNGAQPWWLGEQWEQHPFCPVASPEKYVEQQHQGYRQSLYKLSGGIFGLSPQQEWAIAHILWVWGLGHRWLVANARSVGRGAEWFLTDQDGWIVGTEFNQVQNVLSLLLEVAFFMSLPELDILNLEPENWARLLSGGEQRRREMVFLYSFLYNTRARVWRMILLERGLAPGDIAENDTRVDEMACVELLHAVFTLHIQRWFGHGQFLRIPPVGTCFEINDALPRPYKVVNEGQRASLGSLQSTRNAFVKNVLQIALGQVSFGVGQRAQRVELMLPQLQMDGPDDVQAWMPTPQWAQELSNPEGQERPLQPLAVLGWSRLSKQSFHRFMEASKFSLELFPLADRIPTALDRAGRNQKHQERLEKEKQDRLLISDPVLARSSFPAIEPGVKSGLKPAGGTLLKDSQAARAASASAKRKADGQGAGAPSKAPARSASMQPPKGGPDGNANILHPERAAFQASDLGTFQKFAPVESVAGSEAFSVVSRPKWDMDDGRALGSGIPQRRQTAEQLTVPKWGSASQPAGAQAKASSPPSEASGGWSRLEGWAAASNASQSSRGGWQMRD